MRLRFLCALAVFLHFADHGGKYIRLAYADRLEGPWRVHGPGTLRLEEAAPCHGHIASPDVHVDEETRQVRMYFHGPACVDGKGIGQKSFVALSRDGIRFTARPEVLNTSYFRVFRWGGWHYAIGTRGRTYRSSDGASEQSPLKGLRRAGALSCRAPSTRGSKDAALRPSKAH